MWLYQSAEFKRKVNGQEIDLSKTKSQLREKEYQREDNSAAIRQSGNGILTQG